MSDGGIASENDLEVVKTYPGKEVCRNLVILVVVGEREGDHVYQRNYREHDNAGNRDKQQRLVEMLVKQGLDVVNEARELLACFFQAFRDVGGVNVLNPQEKEHHRNEQREDTVEKYQHGVVAVLKHVNAEGLVELPAALNCSEVPKPCEEPESGVYHEAEVSDLSREVHQTFYDLSAEQAARAHHDVRQLGKDTAVYERPTQPREASAELFKELSERALDTHEEMSNAHAKRLEEFRHAERYLFVPWEYEVINSCHCINLLKYIGALCSFSAAFHRRYTVYYITIAVGWSIRSKRDQSGIETA